MLDTIKITNLALIDKSVVDFHEGFNVLTGETGAGKSLIVDALLFLTGIRADKTLIKSGEEFARVEGVFSIDQGNSKINEILDTIGLENEGTLIISRYFSINGKNECRINGELVTLNILRKISNEILDIFGQNDSIALLNPENHLGLLDNMFADSLSNLKLDLQDKLNSLDQINNKIKELGGLDKDREDNIRLLEFQINEIDQANLQLNEEDEIKANIKIMENSEKIYNSLDSVCQILDGEINISNAMKSAINSLISIEQFDESVIADKDRLFNIKYELDDILSNIESKKNNLNYSEFDLDKLNDRLADIKNLERKYGNTIEDVLQSKVEFQERLDMLINAEEKLETLSNEKHKLLKEIYTICIELRNIRKSEISKFRSKLIAILQSLGMKNANFDVAFLNEINLDTIENDVDINGADRVEFMFSANLGFELRSLSKIISGGEMSRFMLAFKSLQNNDTKKTCIFDEIDTGIGGEVGVVIGQKISEISRNNQVICITHLAQIASFGDSNYKIEKFDENNKTITSVTYLNEDNKVIEIARMLGSSSNQISIDHAKQIIEESNAYKKFKV